MNKIIDIFKQNLPDQYKISQNGQGTGKIIGNGIVIPSQLLFNINTNNTDGITFKLTRLGNTIDLKINSIQEDIDPNQTLEVINLIKTIKEDNLTDILDLMTPNN